MYQGSQDKSFCKEGADEKFIDLTFHSLTTPEDR